MTLTYHRRPGCQKPLLLIPEVRFQGPVQALVERSGGEVAAPVVVVSIGVGEEVSAQHGQRGSGAVRLSRGLQPQGREVVCDRAELGLEHPHTGTDGETDSSVESDRSYIQS